MRRLGGAGSAAALEYIHPYTTTIGGHFQEFAVANRVNSKVIFLNRQGRQECQGNTGAGRFTTKHTKHTKNDFGRIASL